MVKRFRCLVCGKVLKRYFNTWHKFAGIEFRRTMMFRCGGCKLNFVVEIIDPSQDGVLAKTVGKKEIY